jgi:mannosyltransferase OCH1-like enzyme
MNSWKEKLRDYEFILWNFDRFDINSSLWVKQAFEAKKYAFAADFIRLYAVYNFGGIYLDMDIEVVKPFDDLLNNAIMIGYENNKTKDIEAGCFGAEKGSPIIKKCLDYYANRKFINIDGEYDILPLPKIIKKICNQELFENLSFYPSDYFTAKSIGTGIVTVTYNTYCIHHFAGSWTSENEKRWKAFRLKTIKRFGYKLGKLIAFGYFFFLCILSRDMKLFIKTLREKFE